jgi:hypothetical protein
VTSEKQQRVSKAFSVNRSLIKGIIEEKVTPFNPNITTKDIGDDLKVPDNIKLLQKPRIGTAAESGTSKLLKR